MTVVMKYTTTVTNFIFHDTQVTCYTCTTEVTTHTKPTEVY